jgi:hypothetical protein
LQKTECLEIIFAENLVEPDLDVVAGVPVAPFGFAAAFFTMRGA